VSNYYNELQKTPEWKAATASEREKLKVAAEAKWEVDYPLETPLLGVELVPWHGKVVGHGPKASCGLLWSLVPPLQVNTAAVGQVPMFRDEVE
jgi:hypothetical protein